MSRRWAQGINNEVVYTVNVRQPTEYECDVVAKKMVYDLTNRKFTDYSGVSVYLRVALARAIMDAENNLVCTD